MGRQIALNAALSGFRVKCTDGSKEALAMTEQFSSRYLQERISKGKLTPEEAKETEDSLLFTPDLSEAAAEADLVIEAIVENLEAKRAIFHELDEICPPHAILVTNSSTIVSSKIADATRRPSQVCNMHFFNPVLVMKLVEVVKGPHTAKETVDIVRRVAERMGKNPVILEREIFGFLVNRIVAAIRKEALYLLDMGVASPEDIDKAVMQGLGHPMGPFQLLDFTGIDLSYHVNMDLFRESGDITDRPSPAIVEKYVKGEWGRKTKKGFYNYSQD
jgi:3-hydroxybutyryl-CoA dehydrogenase